MCAAFGGIINSTRFPPVATCSFSSVTIDAAFNSLIWLGLGNFVLISKNFASGFACTSSIRFRLAATIHWLLPAGSATCTATGGGGGASFAAGEPCGGRLAFHCAGMIIGIFFVAAVKKGKKRPIVTTG